MVDVARVIQEFLDKNRGRRSFAEHEVKALLKEMGMPLPRGIFVPGREFPVPLPLSYPLVAKVSSDAIASKSDVRGVRTDIRNEDDLEKVVGELMEIRNAQGALIEEMAPPGVEVIVGGIIDRQFGPVVMFGLGGIFVEVFRDVAFGLAPIKKDEALRLVQQTKGYRILEGYRGSPPVDISELLDIVVTVSDIIGTGLIDEIDLNPVALYPHGAIVLDAKMAKTLDNLP